MDWLLVLLTVFAPPSVKKMEVVNHHDTKVKIAYRSYVRVSRSIRFYIDTTTQGDDTLTAIHPEGLIGLFSYQQGVCFSRIGRRPRVFYYDVEKPWDGEDIPIRFSPPYDK